MTVTLLTSNYPEPESAQYLPEKSDRNNLSRQFSHRKQLRRLLLTGLARWLITAALIGAMYRVIYYYSSLPLMSSAQAKTFNALTTAISIALGLNIASSLKSMALDARWWILSQRRRPLGDVCCRRGGLSGTVYKMLILKHRLTQFYTATALPGSLHMQRALAGQE